MKKSVRALKRPYSVITENNSKRQKQKSNVMKTGVVPNSGCSRSDEKTVVDEFPGTVLTNDEEAALIKQNRHYMKNKNILGMGIEERKIDGKKKDFLVFLVENGKKADEIPKYVLFETNCGERMEITTAVEKTGKIVPLRVEAGDAVEVSDPPNVFGSTTIGAIMSFPDEDSPVRLLTSAHLIDYDEKHIGKMLYYLKREDYDKQQPRSSFLNPELELFPVTSFYPVRKYSNPLTGEAYDRENITRNKLDVLWADVSSEINEKNINSKIAGKKPKGIRAPRQGEYFNLFGLSSGIHRAKVLSTTYELSRVPHYDPEGNILFYTFWQNLVKFQDERPFLQGDSGSALVSDDDYVIGLLSFGDDTGVGYACQLHDT